jgi:aminoglycoside phosphotransferase
MNLLHANVTAWLETLLSPSFEVEKHSYSHQDAVYHIKMPDISYYLKIADDLTAEHSNIVHIGTGLLTPGIFGFARMNSADHLLMSELPGKNLAEWVGEWPDTVIVQEFAKAVRTFHSLDPSTIFPDQDTMGLVVIHGDMSLPNIISPQPGSAGYIDLGKSRPGTPDADLVDALWSIQRNLGTGYGELFLQQYGTFDMTPTIEAALRFKYTP